MLNIMNRLLQKPNRLLAARVRLNTAYSLLCVAMPRLRIQQLRKPLSVRIGMYLALSLPFTLPVLAYGQNSPAQDPDQPFFDTHLHYNSADAKLFSPADIISRLQQNGVSYAAVTSTPAEHSLALYQQAPQQIIPLLGVYRSPADKISWVNDVKLPDRLATQLKQGPWRGIGELHIFAENRHSPVFNQVIQLAREHQMPLFIHGDPAVIDTVYQIATGITVIWAHGGTFAYPDLLADYLQRYPALMVDLSVRDSRIAPQGRLDDAWYQLFIHYPGRFLLGVDTYAPGRWQNYADALARIRHWLNQLPEDIALQMAYENAIKVYQLETAEHD